MLIAQSSHLTAWNSWIILFILQGEDGMTALHISAKHGNVDCLKYLLYHCDLDVNLKDDGGWTPIIWASEYGHVETVKFLMSAGADPNIRDNVSMGFCANFTTEN